MVELDGQMEPPQRHYQIRQPPAEKSQRDPVTSTHTAKPLTSVHVGDEILHEWVCSHSRPHPMDGKTDMNLLYGLLVHDCYVDDGRGRKVLMVDSKGCATDSVILPTPTYSTGELKATASSLVAKFPDQELLGFECSITVCMRELGHCNGVTVSLAGSK